MSAKTEQVRSSRNAIPEQEMNKKIIFYGLSLAIILVCVFFVKNYENASPIPATFSSPSIFSTTTTKVLNSNEIKINFVAGAKDYSLKIPDGSTIYDAMNILARAADFSFKADLYPSLGYFVREINGVKNSGGYYWTLYVNGEYLNVGASAYKLSQGDDVDWKYEK